MIAWLQKLVVVSTYTFLLYLFSERLFWNFVRPTGQSADTIPHLLTGLLLYFFLTYAVLILIYRYQVRTFSGLLIVGLVYSFLTEIAVAGMFFQPQFLPISIPWHTIFTVLGSLYFLPRFFASKKPWQKITASAGAGVIYTLWSMGWLATPASINYTYEGFLINTLVATILISLSYFCLRWAKKLSDFTFSGFDILYVSLFFLLFPIIHYGIYTPIILGLLLSGTWYAIKLLKRYQLDTDDTSTNILKSAPNLPTSTYFYFWLPAFVSLPLMWLIMDQGIKFNTLFILAAFLLYLLIIYIFRLPK